MLYNNIKNILLITIKIVILVFTVFLQCYFFYYIFTQNSIYIGYIYAVLTILKLTLIIYMVNKQTKPEHTLLWLTLTVIFPILGVVIYILFSTKTIQRKFKNNISNVNDNMKRDNNYRNILKEIKEKDIYMYNTVKYINNVCGYNVRRTEINRYYETGEIFFKDFLNDIKNAKKYIFINFFIITKGKMLNETLEVLKEKAKSGVKVYIIFDHMGSVTKYPKEVTKIKDKNFSFLVFNPISYNFNIYLNIRNHRKIIVVDGNISYTGGLNIGDEYINEGNFKARWKDSAIRLEGNISNDFLSLFIKLWNMYCNKEDKLDYREYINNEDIIESKDNGGYQLVYLDGVDTKSHVAKNIFEKLINESKEKAFIMTPYLMLDGEMLNTLKRCGRSGIDIRIITPKVGDNSLVHAITRSYYRELIENNIRIYEYIPGFIHSKIIFVDDRKVSISSVNLDYRSMYFHYENGVLIYYDDKVINEIKNDFQHALKECEEVNYEWIRSHNYITIFKPILKLIAPLM